MTSDGHLFLLSLITFGAGLIFFLAGFVFFLIHRRHASAGRLTRETRAVQPGLVPSPVAQNAPPSPLTLIRFKQALEGDGLNEAVLEFGREALNLGLLGQGANFAIRSIEAGKRIGGMDIVLRFGGRGLQLAQEGEVTIPIHSAAGRWLPELQDRSGRFVEIASGSGEVLGTLANVSALVVSVAYMVVSRDTLRRLRSIETSIEGLLTGRLARLFTEARVLTFGILLFGASLTAQVWFHEPRLVAVIMCFGTFGMALSMPNIQALISRSTTAATSGPTMSGWSPSGFSTIPGRATNAAWHPALSAPATSQAWAATSRTCPMSTPRARATA